MQAFNTLFPALHGSSRPAIADSILAQFRLAALALVATTLLLQWGLAHINHERQQIARTEAIERDLRELGEDLIDAETGQRGFLLTGNPAYLEPFSQSAARISAHETRLLGLISDASAQRALSSLEPVVQDKLAELDETIRLMQTGQRTAALAIVNSDKGRRLMDRFRRMRSETLAIEGRLLEQRRQNVAQAVDLVVLCSVFSAALSIFLLFIAARRSAARLGAPVRALLERIERFADISPPQWAGHASSDEILRLNLAFDRMTLALKAAETSRERALGDASMSHVQAIKAEARYQQLFESAPAMLHAIDRQGRILTVSDRWLEVLGYAKDEVIGRSVTDFLTHASKIYATEQVLPEFFQQGRCDDIDYQFVHKDGVILDVLLSAVLQRDASGEDERSVTVLTDVTERKRLKRALQSQAALIEDLYDHAPCGYHSVDPDGRFLHINATGQHWLGCTARELVGLRSPIEFCRETDRDKWRQAFTRARDTLTEQRVEVVLIGRHHGPRDVNIAISVVTDDRGAFLMTRSVMFDISQLKLTERTLQATKSFLAQTGAAAGVGGWSFDLPSGEVVWSDETYRLHDVTPGTRIALEDALAFYTLQAQPVIAAAMRECAASGTPFDLELEMVSADGRPFWARAVGIRQWQEGLAVRLIGALQDISARKQADRALADSHELLRVTLDSIGDAVITTDTAGRIEWLNPVAERLTGWMKAEAQGRELLQVFQILHEESRQPAIDPVATCLAQGRIVGLANHTVLLSRNGSEYAIEDSASPIRDVQGNVLGAVLVFHDVSEQRRLGNEMSYRVTHDGLTDLLNRAEFETRLARVLKTVRDGVSKHALMFIDLDQFKLVNDACGHAVGDQLLRQVGAMLQRSVRSHDTVARLGGDEFGLLLENCDAEQADTVGRKICDQMDEFRFIHDGRRFRIGTSIGLVQLDARWSQADAVMNAADTACYAAKEAGRNRVHTWFDTDTQAHTRQRQVGWASRLEQAIDENQFLLFGQRIQGLQGPDHGLHCEVLLRLPDEQGELIAPSVFLPAAERFHLMPRIDRWVVRKVVQMLNAPTEPHLVVHSIAINLSGQSIGDRSFHRDLFALLQDARFDLRTLCFEITETAAITNLEDAGTFFQDMRALGVRVALDDFGAGASSFGYLKNLPVDVIKIDGQFITDLLQNPLDSAAVRCFRDVAQVVGVQTVAEFVGEVDIRDRLIEMGIDFAQGHLIHRPEPLINLLRSTDTAVS